MSNIYCIPGWGFKASIFNEFFPFSCKLIELPQLNNLSLESIAEHLNPQIPKDSILIGWSIGGAIAMQLACQYSDKYSALITIATNPKFKPNSSLIEQAKNNLPAMMENFIKLVCYPSTDIKKRKIIKDNLLDPNTHHTKLLNYLNLIFRYDISQLYTKLSCPSLHIVGTQDLIFTAPKANQFKFLKNSGHAPFITEQNNLVEYITNFIDKN